MGKKDPLEIDPDDVNPALMATLWLLDLYLRYGVDGLPLKLTDNLAALSTHRALAEESRLAVRRLGSLWQARIEDAARAAPMASPNSRIGPPSDASLH
jgi:hypothetical protein